jgi:hypothetical protein
MNRLLISLSSVCVLAGCMAIPASQNDSRECAQNFSSQGFMNYRTSVVLKGVDKDLAMKRLVRELGRKGFSLNKNDTAEGHVSANFDAGRSGLLLSAFFEKSGGNSKVELNYKGSGASVGSLFVSQDAYMRELCVFAEAMAR